MAIKRVNPNRMELLKLKNKLKTARRGHKLLKDKRDEMMRRYLDLIRKTAEMREKTEAMLARAGEEMLLATAVAGPKEIDTALLSSGGSLEIMVGTSNLMGLKVPEISVAGMILPGMEEDEPGKEVAGAQESGSVEDAGNKGQEKRGSLQEDLDEDEAARLAMDASAAGINAGASGASGSSKDKEVFDKWPLPYGNISISAETDQALLAVREAIPYILALAAMEKKTLMLGVEIEKTSRRVNSLEYRMIPELEETIRNIAMKMDENERGNLTRLMKVKEMIIEQNMKAGKY